MQHILSVNIIFGKKIAFLLGVFTSLELGLVRFLRDRSKAKVGTTIRIILAKAPSGFFKVVELHPLLIMRIGDRGFDLCVAN